MEFMTQTNENMKKLITQSVFFLVLYSGFSQSETKVFSHEDYHLKSIAFIQYLKNGGDFNDLSLWYEGKIQDDLTEKLYRLSTFAHKKEETEFGIFLGYRDDVNLLIDDIKTLEDMNISKAQESKKDKSEFIPPPPPPPYSKGKH